MNFEYLIPYLCKFDALDFLRGRHDLLKMVFARTKNLNISYLGCLIDTDDRNIAYVGIGRTDSRHK
jgi:hypothetical protein